MARFCGKVGYGETVEVRPGSWDDVIVERTYYGDVVLDKAVFKDGDGVVKDVTVQNVISIVADSYANEHISNIRYVEWAGAVWVVDNVAQSRPRLTLRLGGVYNGPRPDPTP